MESRRFIVFVTVIIAVTIVRNVSSAEDNSTNSTVSSSYDYQPQSGDGEYGTTYDDEDGLYSEDYHVDDYNGYGDSNDGDLYTFEGPGENGKEWEGFDGKTCSDGARIGKRKICDGVPDCFDCSDEENCSDASAHIFMCYRQGHHPMQRYDHKNPKCIPLAAFCDGVSDCANGADELKLEAGFKCQIKGKFQTCNLPSELICDEIVHCEDESDVCKEIPAGSAGIRLNGTSDSRASSSKPPDGFFRCLTQDILISVHQLCDGVFDCPDLSDECLCEVQRSTTVEEVCGGLCAKPLWTDQPDNPNCQMCSQGEIYLRNDGESGSEKKNCYTPGEVMEILFLKRNASEQSMVDEDDIVECIDQTLSGAIRARKCDGRPECFFGEDECNIGCSNGGKKDWIAGSGSSEDPPFCKLLKDGLSFSCLSAVEINGMKNASNDNLESALVKHHVTICDGVIECTDESDEAFCPKRFKCSPDSDDANTPTFDESQRCDGVRNCPNGEDEMRNCSYSSRTKFLPCDSTTAEEETLEYFDVKYLLNGEKECSTGADECPPFLSKIPQMLDKYFEGVPDKESQSGISSHDRAMDNLPLQVITIAAAFIGISALLISLILGLYNIILPFGKFCKFEISDRRVWMHNCLVCAREVVVSLGMTAAKVLFCAYFAFIRIRRSEDVNYSLHDLKWRAGNDCNAIGALSLIGAQVPLFILAIFAVCYVVLRKRFLNDRTQDMPKNGRSEGEGSWRRNEEALNVQGRRRYKLILISGCMVLVIITWLPIVILALVLVYPTSLHDRTQTYAWIRADAAPTVFRANLVDQKRAAAFASTIISMKNATFESPVEYFSFSKFEGVVSSVAPSLGLKYFGSYGYFAHSGTCLPALLVHANGGEVPFDMAVSNSWTSGTTLFIFALDLLLVFTAILLTSRYGSGVCKSNCRETQVNHKEQYALLNHTFSRFVLIESFTWLLIIFLFFLKAVIGDGFSDYAYTACCFVILGLNCGIVTPFVLLTRKFRLLKSSRKSIVKLRPQTFPDFVEICDENAVNEEHEKEPLTNGKDSVKKESNNNERQSLVNEEEIGTVDDLS